MDHEQTEDFQASSPVMPDTPTMTTPDMTAPVMTGHAGVDGVLTSLEALEDLPVAEHVEIFDRAHERLRQALDEAGTQSQHTDS